MALSDLIARLEHEAQARAEDIRRQAATEVRAIEVATEQAVTETTARQIERGRAERQQADRRALALASQQARVRELEARHAQIARILARARAVIPEIAASPVYTAALPSHVREAMSFLQGLRPRVRCQAALAPVVRPVIAGYDGATFEVERGLGPGVVAEAADGSVQVDNTLAARLARAELRLTIELGRKLADGRQ